MPGGIPVMLKKGDHEDSVGSIEKEQEPLPADVGE